MKKKIIKTHPPWNKCTHVDLTKIMPKLRQTIVNQKKEFGKLTSDDLTQLIIIIKKCGICAKTFCWCNLPQTVSEACFNYKINFARSNLLAEISIVKDTEFENLNISFFFSGSNSIYWELWNWIDGYFGPH